MDNYDTFNDTPDIEDPLELFEWYSHDIEESLDAIKDLCKMVRKLQTSKGKKKCDKAMAALDRYMTEANDLLNVLWYELDTLVG